MLSLLFKEI